MSQKSTLSLKKKLLTGGLACVLAAGSVSALADKDKDRERGGWGEHHEYQGRGGMGYGAYGAGPMMGGGMGYYGMGYGGFPMQEVDLNRSQRKQIEDIMEKHHDDNRDHRRTMQDLHDDYMQGVLSNASSTELNNLIGKQADLMKEQMQQQSQIMQEMLQVLTPEQKEQLKKRYK